MTKRATRAAQIAVIDQMVRAVAWSAHKQVIHTLADPAINLTLPQLITLFAIRDQGPCRMSGLSEITQQSAGTLTGIVDRLIADGLVERIRNADDRRVVEVLLTPAGAARLDHAVRACQEDMQRILAHFSEQDLAHFEALLHRFLTGLDSRMSADGHLARTV